MVQPSFFQAATLFFYLGAWHTQNQTFKDTVDSEASFVALTTHTLSRVMNRIEDRSQNLYILEDTKNGSFFCANVQYVAVSPAQYISIFFGSQTVNKKQNNANRAEQQYYE